MKWIKLTNYDDSARIYVNMCQIVAIWRVGNETILGVAGDAETIRVQEEPSRILELINES